LTFVAARRALVISIATLVLTPLATVPMFAQQFIGTVPVPGYLFGMAENSATNHTYIAGVNGFDASVVAIDGNTLSTTTIPVEGSTPALLVNQVTNKIYMGVGTSLAVIDGATQSVTYVPVNGTGSIALNTATNKIYVVTYYPFSITVVDGLTLQTTSIPMSFQPGYIAVNEATNKIFVTDGYGQGMVVIDGVNYSTTMLYPGAGAGALAVNPYTNQIYVLGYTNPNGSLTVIDGATLSMTLVTIPNGSFGRLIAINALTNKIYVPLPYNGVIQGAIAIIDGNTLSVSEVAVNEESFNASDIKVNPFTNRVYMAASGYPEGPFFLSMNGTSGTINKIMQVAPTNIIVDSTSSRIYAIVNGGVDVLADAAALKFVPVRPCRVVDTRLPDGPFGGPAITGGTYRSFALPQGSCNIPPSAAAYALNVTVVPQGPLGYLTVWGAGEAQPVVSTLNSPDGRIKANAAIVDSGMGGVNVFASQTTNVVLDINGYFERSSSTALAFYPLSGCRVVDTRKPNGSLGGPSLTAQQERDFPILASSCDIPSSALAYSFNVTALPHGGLGYLTAWPQGQAQPVVSTLNAPTGTATANAALIPAGTNGGVAVYPSNDTDLVIDVNGYFAPIGPGGLSLYTTVPCRALDTRSSRGAFIGTILVDVVDSGCGVHDALAYVMNATVVPQGGLGYLTVWPTTEFQPNVSTLNAWDGRITSNMVIVSNIDGWLDAFASNPTQLILDSFAYFAP
jgi:DNA-binding beta-propeller fold protein YncE